MGFEIVMIVFNKASYEFLWLPNTGYNFWLKNEKNSHTFQQILLRRMNVLMEEGDIDRTVIHCVRGQSGFFNLALTEGNMQIKFDLKLSVYSLGLDI